MSMPHPIKKAQSGQVTSTTGDGAGVIQGSGTRIVASRHLDISLPQSHSREMRTTLVIEDDVLAAARSLAEAEGKSLGEVISFLTRRGLAPQHEEALDEGFPVFAVSPEAKPLTPEMVQRALGGLR